MLLNSYSMPFSIHRLRTLFLCIAIILFIHSSLTAQTADTSKANKQFKDFKTEHVWDAKVKISNMLMLGESKRGTRRIIPITGGTFEGPNIKGEVLPLGADWQTVRGRWRHRIKCPLSFKDK